MYKNYSFVSYRFLPALLWDSALPTKLKIKVPFLFLKLLSKFTSEPRPAEVPFIQLSVFA